MPSAFIVFSNENRDQVKQDKPNCSFGEIGRELGKRWNALSEEEKSKYVGTKNKKKKTSKKQQRRRLDEEDDDDDEEEAPRKKAKSSTRKRRAPSAFIVFSNEKREEVKRANPKASFGELGKRLGKMWRALSADEKQKYGK
jgi:hypothetical protein